MISHRFTVRRNDLRIAYNAGIGACEKGSQWQLALEMMAQLEQQQLESTAVTASHAASALGRNGWQETLNFVMIQPVFSKELVSLGQMACANMAQWLRALSAFGEASKKRLEVDTMMFTAAISASEKGQIPLTFLGSNVAGLFL